MESVTNNGKLCYPQKSFRKHDKSALIYSNWKSGQLNKFKRNSGSSDSPSDSLILGAGYKCPYLLTN